MNLEISDFQGKTCVIYGAASNPGRIIAESMSEAGANLGLIDLDKYSGVLQGNTHSGPFNYKALSSANDAELEVFIDGLVAKYKKIDYLVCSFYFDQYPKALKGENMSLELWDEMMSDWMLGYFHVLRTVAPKMLAEGNGRIVYLVTTTGYLGFSSQGEVSLAGSLQECGLASGIIGMMTSIARDVIPKGVSVNGIALGPNYKADPAALANSVQLWLSGKAEYACGDIIKID